MTILRIYRLYPDAPSPCRADKTLFGSLPLRAVRGCEPVTAASGFGWYVYPPRDFSLLWDGSNLYYTHDNDKTPSWQRFRTVKMPGLAEVLASHAPKALHELAQFPWLTRGTEPGLVQMWTGLAVRTRENWSVLVRPPANLPRDPTVEVYDGLIESDWWFGPLLTVFRMCKTDTPVPFRRTRPIAQLQPVYRLAHTEALLNDIEVVEHAKHMTQSDWEDYERTLSYRQNALQPTNYRNESRKHRIKLQQS
jgi:hypothetical protein